MITNIGLVEFAVSKLGCAYIYGCQGELVTEALIQRKAAQYPDKFDGYKIIDGIRVSYIDCCRKWIGKIGYDCSSLIDCYTGYDKSANGWFDIAKERGLINTMPDIKGLLVHMEGHVGIYIGNGEVLEARGVLFGVVITKLSEREWTKWSKCPYITYIVRPVNPYPMPTKTLYRFNPLMTKTDVKWLQFELNWRYGSVIAIDGSFGPITKQYLGTFQKNTGLVVDYKCGRLTKVKLVTSIK